MQYKRMKKAAAALALAVVLGLSLWIPAGAADCFGGAPAAATYVDGCLVTPIESEELEGVVYSSVKGFAVVMGAEAVRLEDGVTTVEIDGKTVELREDSRILTVDGEHLYLADGPVKVVNNTVMAPLEALCRAFDALLTVEEETGNTLITTDAGIPDDLTRDEVDLMARLVFAESGNQCLAGQIGVANVLLNRIGSGWFPTRITDIIFDRSSGIQFSTAYNGAIYNTPTASCYEAVWAALEGENTVGNSLFFASILNCWANENRPLITQIQAHYFWG